MKTSLLICFYIFLISGFSKGQNLISPSGLKYGPWTDTIENSEPHGRVIRKGSYFIIPVNFYPIIEKSSADIFLKVRYFNANTYIFYSKVANDSISVSNGIWTRFDSLGNLIGMSLWNKGIMLSSQDYDALGNLVYADSSDYESNCYTAYHFIENRLFYKKQQSFNSNIPSYEYYPNDNLALDNAEPNLISDFIKRPIDTFKIELLAKNNIEIVNILDSFGNFKFIDKKKNPVSYPLKISKGSKAVIYAIFKPSPNSLKNSETIIIVSNEPNKKEYPIYATTCGYHLNYKTVESISKFSLSISKDKYLILPPMGTVTTISITDSSGKVKYYHISNLTKINLSEFCPGKYCINTIACNAGGSQIMLLRE